MVMSMFSGMGWQGGWRWMPCGLAAVVALVLAAPVAAQKASTPAAKAAAAKPERKPPAKPAAPAAAPAPALPYRTGAVPAWVVDTPVPPLTPAQNAPMAYRIVEDQFLVEGAQWSEFSRIVRVVRDNAGLASAAQWELSFHPSHQTMTLHRIDVVRNGVRSARLPTQRIEVLQRETQLEQRIYDGTLTLSIVLDDIRQGDEIDVAYTVAGANPVFGGRFVHMAWMGTDRGPVARWHTRLVAPAGRTIHTKLGPRDARESIRLLTPELRESTWLRDNVPMQQAEPGTPWSAMTPELLQLSEFANWAEVAAWGAKVFEETTSGAQVAARADAIRAAHATPAAQLAEALRFVQQEVRYFGISIGPHSHKPNPSERVLEQRFGDCKDKVALLAALLKRLEIPVQPLLVSSRLRERVEEIIPSPLAFDHVIARVELDGKPLLLDPTFAHQRGPLGSREPAYSRGLLLAGSGPLIQSLQRLPEPYSRPMLAVDDVFTITDFSRGAELVSRIRWNGDMAEGVRASAAEGGLQRLADGVNVHYLRVWPGLKRQGEPTLEHASDAEAVTLVQRFALPEYWRWMEQRVLQADVLLWAGVEALLPPKMEARRTPLGFDFPGRYSHRVRIDFPENVFRESATRRVDDRDRHFSLDIDIDAGTRHIEYRAEVALKTDRVEPQDWASYQGALQKSLQRLGFAFGVPALPLARIDALSKEMQELDEQVRRQRVRANTSVQLRSLVEVRAMTAQLDAGRLSPPLRQQALTARGIAWDHLGDLDKARADHEAALLLAPDSADALNAAAVNAQGRGDLARTLELTGRALERQPRDNQALATRARAFYMADRFDEARSELEKVLTDRGELRRGYPLIWLTLATARSGGDLKALRERYPAADWPSDWPRPVLDALLPESGKPAANSSEADAALKAARASKSPLEAQTEAHFYLGERRAIDGGDSAARDAWKRTLDFGVTEYVEFQAARQRLAKAVR